MKLFKSLFVLCFLAALVPALAQAPAAQGAPPVTAPVIGTPTKGGFELLLGPGHLFFPNTADHQYAIDGANYTLNAELRWWINDHTAIGFAYTHDTIFVHPLFPNLPAPTHAFSFYDLTAVYTLSTFDPGVPIPAEAGQAVSWLTSHAKRITVDTVGGVGIVVLDHGPVVASYFLGAETNYWIDANWSAKLITAIRHTSYLGNPATFAEVKLLCAYKFHF